MAAKTTTSTSTTTMPPMMTMMMKMPERLMDSWKVFACWGGWLLLMGMWAWATTAESLLPVDCSTCTIYNRNILLQATSKRACQGKASAAATRTRTSFYTLMKTRCNKNWLNIIQQQSRRFYSFATLAATLEVEVDGSRSRKEATKASAVQL